MKTRKAAFYFLPGNKTSSTEQEVLRSDGCCVIKVLKSTKLLPVEGHGFWKSRIIYDL